VCFEQLRNLACAQKYNRKTGRKKSSGQLGRETWMFPVLAALFPDLARAAAQYRLDRLNASLANANAMGYDGAEFAWENRSQACHAGAVLAAL
jgi:hypothetical protein